MLQLAVKQHYGIRAEKLAEFGMQPFRGRSRTGEAGPDPGPDANTDPEAAVHHPQGLRRHPVVLPPKGVLRHAPFFVPTPPQGSFRGATEAGGASGKLPSAGMSFRRQKQACGARWKLPSGYGSFRAAEMS